MIPHKQRTKLITPSTSHIVPSSESHFLLPRLVSYDGWHILVGCVCPSHLQLNFHTHFFLRKKKCYCKSCAFRLYLWKAPRPSVKVTIPRRCCSVLKITFLQRINPRQNPHLFKLVVFCTWKISKITHSKSVCSFWASGWETPLVCAMFVWVFALNQHLKEEIYLQNRISDVVLEQTKTSNKGKQKQWIL